MNYTEYMQYEKYGPAYVAVMRVEREATVAKLSKVRQSRREMVIMWEEFWFNAWGKEMYNKKRREDYAVEMDMIVHEAIRFEPKIKHMKNIKKFMADKGFTQRQLAKEVGTSEKTVSKVMRTGEGVASLERKIRAKFPEYGG